MGEVIAEGPNELTRKAYEMYEEMIASRDAEIARLKGEVERLSDRVIRNTDVNLATWRTAKKWERAARRLAKWRDLCLDELSLKRAICGAQTALIQKLHEKRMEWKDRCDKTIAERDEARAEVGRLRR